TRIRRHSPPAVKPANTVVRFRGRLPTPPGASAREQDGGAEGSRTPDLVIANDALYQLSYGPPIPTAGRFQARARHRSGGAPVSTVFGPFAAPAPVSLD